MIPPIATMTWEFGSRSGSWLALCLFAALFGVLGWGVSRELRQRAGATGVARGVGLLLFLGPVVLVYASSLSGFYEAEVDGTMLRLRYLLPCHTEIPLVEVSAVEPIPWYRGRWRLQVVARSGQRHESATWHRTAVFASAARLQQLVAEPAGR
jgi:hypothetical protein